MKWDGPAVDRAVAAAALNGLEDAANELERKANETVPIDTAVLKLSSQVDIDASTLTAVVSYDTTYAVRQHEDLTYRHAPGRRARWLELTALEEADRLAGYVIEAMKRAGGKS